MGAGPTWLKRSVSSTVLTLLAAFVLAACTGTGSDSEQASQEPGRAQGTEAPDSAGDPESQLDGSPAAFATAYRAAADRYADALEEIQSEGAPVVAEDPVGADEVYEDLRAVTEAARADFDALDPPAEFADALDGVLDNFSAQIRTLADSVDAARERDDRALQRGLEDYADQLSVWRERHTELTERLADA